MKNKFTEKQLYDFLRESNAIEGVHDHQSFVDALEAWDYLIRKNEMTIDVMRQTHRLLMRHQNNLSAKEKGHFRRIPVYIGNKEAMDHTIIKQRLEILCMNMNLSPNNWEIHHVEYEKIHPFVDGNGRTGRMFLNWERVRKLHVGLQIYRADERHEYYKLFH